MDSESFVWGRVRGGRLRLGAYGALLALVALGSAAHAAGSGTRGREQAESAEVDHLGLAARLMSDGHYERVLAVLREVQPDAEGIDTPRYYTLRGLARLKQRDFAGARSDIEAAIARGQQDPSLSLHLAQACYALADHTGALGALERAGALADSEPAALLMRADSEWKLGRRSAAVAALRRGAARFPTRPDFERAQIFYLIELGLYIAAAEVSDRYLNRAAISAEDYVAVGEALLAAKQRHRAALVLEGARLKFPEDEKLMVQLAHAYLSDGKLVTSAMLFEQAARFDEKYALEAAELYKQAGLHHRAEGINGRVLDQTAKSKQRLGLLVDAQDFEAVTSMLPKLSRLGLLEDEQIRYAVAYAYFKTGRFDEAEEHLKLLDDPQLFESALQLRRAMDACRQSGWECNL